MDTLQLLGLAGAAIAGALAGAAACYWPLSRTVAQLQHRLERTEQARNGAVERSALAREQIAQLNRAITELRRAHSHRPPQETQREQLERVLTEGEERTRLLHGSDAAQAFADTEPLPLA